ncbi:MAG: pyridoxine 5'-phosphate synthase [Deferribacterota bacterium]|nr:pyridoxine 5'-phosphate synthase [Deferribacterota bacterium]
MVKLGVNIDHVATVRQARLSKEPDPVRCAVLVELAGADGITIHLREDRRHIQERDLMLLKNTIKTRLNLEMACSEEIINIALKYKPDMCSLVPEKREELTTEGGLDVAGNVEFYRRVIEKLKNSGIRVSTFIDADKKQIEASYRAGSEVVEIHTGHFADAVGEQKQIELKRVIEAANYAKDLGLLVSAGHGLDYNNIKEILDLKFLYEVNIGHSIIARSIYVGIYDAVKTMRELIEKYV